MHREREKIDMESETNNRLQLVGGWIDCSKVIVLLKVIFFLLIIVLLRLEAWLFGFLVLSFFRFQLFLLLEHALKLFLADLLIVFL